MSRVIVMGALASVLALGACSDAGPEDRAESTAPSAQTKSQIQDGASEESKESAAAPAKPSETTAQGPETEKKATGGADDQYQPPVTDTEEAPQSVRPNTTTETQPAN